MVKYPYLDYKIVAEDNSGNRTETIPCRVEVSFGLQPDWIEDFSEEPFFWVWDGDWEWGEPGGSGSPAPQYGGKLMATNLDGNYSDNSYSYLMLPPLDLREESLPGLRLITGTTSNLIAMWLLLPSAPITASWDEYYFTGRDRQWRTSIINLAPYAGSPNPVTILLSFIVTVRKLCRLVYRSGGGG